MTAHRRGDGNPPAPQRLVGGGDGYGGGCSPGDVVFLLPVADGGADGVFCEDRAVDLDRRESEFLDDVGVGDGEGLGDRFALDPLGGEGAGGDRSGEGWVGEKGR